MAYELAKDRMEEREAGLEHRAVKTMRRRLTRPDELCEKEETNRKMIRCARILERIVNQNNFSDIALGRLHRKCLS